MTVRKLGRSVPGDPGAAAQLGELRRIVCSHPAFDLTICGLNLSPTTVFAQVFAHDQVFHSLRRRLGAVAERSVDQSKVERLLDGLARNLAHANVVRFSGVTTAGLIDKVSDFRRTHFGRWTVMEVEVVRSDKLLSSEGSYVIERIPLAPP